MRTRADPGLPPGRYFRLLLIGYFEVLDAERAIAWRAADSFALREFLGLVVPEAPPVERAGSASPRAAVPSAAVPAAAPARERALPAPVPTPARPQPPASAPVSPQLTASAAESSLLGIHPSDPALAEPPPVTGRGELGTPDTPTPPAATTAAGGSTSTVTWRRCGM